jgi:hypothetical protein
MTRYATINGCCETPDLGLGAKRPEFCEHERFFYTVAQVTKRGYGKDVSPLRSGDKPSITRHSKKRGKGFSTSPEQKKAKSGRACIVCGRDEAEATIDAAHVTPRRLAPHCDCPKGIVPLCRTCHSRYDDLNEPFDLLPALMANGLYEETVHGFLEHGVSLRELMDTITGTKWAPVELEGHIQCVS